MSDRGRRSAREAAQGALDGAVHEVLGRHFVDVLLWMIESTSVKRRRFSYVAA